MKSLQLTTHPILVAKDFVIFPVLTGFSASLYIN